MNTNVKIAILIGFLLLFYILYINNIYLSYKIYNDDKLNDYDKIMLKTTNITQSLVFILYILSGLYLYDKIDFKNIKYNYNVFLMILGLLYYGYSLYINYNHFNNKYDLNNMNDNKNKYLRYHIYSSIFILSFGIVISVYNRKMI
jgi:hypothetical protein